MHINTLGHLGYYIRFLVLSKTQFIMPLISLLQSFYTNTDASIALVTNLLFRTVKRKSDLFLTL